jgi:serine protease Do
MLLLDPANLGWSGIAFGADAPIWMEGRGRAAEDAEVARFNRALAKMAQSLKPAVVQIGISGGPAAREEGEPPGDRPRVGSGFIIHPSGYIVTNSHVIEQATAVEVHLLDQRKFPAKVVGKDSRTDLALLKIQAPADLPAIPLGDSDALEVGELVLTVGNPFGLGQSVSMGIVSRKGPGLRPGGPFEDYIQTDASINPGNSGGPLVNSRGEAVGVVTAVIPNRRVGFAIPINLAKGLLPELREKGKIAWGFLGVGIQNLSEDTARAFALKEAKGALVNNVLAGMPAGAAGVKRGDVIVGFDGQDIPDVRTLQRIVSRTPVGKRVEVRVMRGGQLETLTAVVTEAGGASRVGSGGGSLPARDLGLQVDDLDSEGAKKFKLGKDEEGVVITEVAKGGPAATAGVRPGDLVREVNRRSVASAEEFRRALRRDDPGAPDLLLIKRGEGYLYVAIRPKI